MTYRAVQVVLRLGASLYVGWRRAGNLWQTRPYILASQLLAALAARCAEWEIGGSVGRDPAPYAGKLAWFRNNIRATYLFPTLEKDPVKSYLPLYVSLGNLIWTNGDEEENLTREKFDYIFLDAEMRTALDYQSVSALEGSLFCMEYIRPWTRDIEMGGRKGPRPVFFAGYLFLSEEAVIRFQEAKGKLAASNIVDILRNLLHCLQVGGERKYGWGLLLADENSVKENPLPNTIFGRKGISLSGTVNGVNGNNELYASVIKGEPLPAHASMQNAECKLSGPVEVLVQRTTTDGRYFGQNISLTNCFLPGSRCKNEKSVFKINPEGLWVKISESDGKFPPKKNEIPHCEECTS